VTANVLAEIVIATEVGGKRKMLRGHATEKSVSFTGRSRRGGGDHWEPDDGRRNGDVSQSHFLARKRMLCLHPQHSVANVHVRAPALGPVAVLPPHGAGLDGLDLVRDPARARARVRAAEIARVRIPSCGRLVGP
jgi:hypothetical protein